MLTEDRLSLHDLLLGVLVYLGIREVDDNGHLYYQPPENVKMKFPAIVYALGKVPTQHADNIPYVKRSQYTVTAIDKNPDSRLPEQLLNLPRCRFDRSFSSDNMNHWVFTITI